MRPGGGAFPVEKEAENGKNRFLIFDERGD